MTPTRRQFIRELGIMLVSLIAAGCVPNTPPTATPTATPTPPLAAPGGGDEPPRERVHSCWLGFDWLAQQGEGETRDEKEDHLAQATDQLSTNHRQALDELVADGMLSEGVAEYVHSAFVTIASRVQTWRIREWVTCYARVEPPTPSTPNKAAERQFRDYINDSPDRLIRQADLLAEMARRDEFDRDAVGQAQAIIERDMALLRLAGMEKTLLLDKLAEIACQPCCGGYSSFPLDTLVEIDPTLVSIDPEAAEAACFLVELLVGQCVPVPTQQPTRQVDWPTEGDLCHAPQGLLWLRWFDEIAEITQRDSELGKEYMEDLVRRNWNLYKTLEEAKEWRVIDESLDRMAVAEQMKIALSAIAYHVWRSNAGAACSWPGPLPEYACAGAKELHEQMYLVFDMGRLCMCDTDALAEVKGVIAHALAFLSLSQEQVASLADELRDAWGDTLPPFDELELEIQPETTRVAQILFESFLGFTW